MITQPSASRCAGPGCHAVDVLRLDGKVAFISGIGSVGPGGGNGRATATLFARQGAEVFGVDVDDAAAEETAALIRAEGGTCELHRCDMTDGDAVARAV